MFYLILSAFLLFAGPVPVPPELEQSAKEYWTLMAKRDKFAALKYVAKGCENDFIARRDPGIHSWKYIGAEMESAERAKVNVEVEAVFPNLSSAQKLTNRQEWIREDGAWKVVVRKPKVPATFGAVPDSKKKKEAPTELVVSPSTLRINFLNDSQTANFSLTNGTQDSAAVEKVEFDREKFELIGVPDQVAPGQTVKMKVRYKGAEISKNLPAELRIFVKQKQEERTLTVPLTYNYLSDGTRALFGLSRKQAEELKRGTKLTPVLKPTGGARPPAANKPQ